MKKQLLEKLQNKTARVGVVGLGYVGLPLAVEFAHAGFHVTGLDVDHRKIDKLNAGESYIQDIPTSVLKPL
ncbi:MAG: NAD(P)-binding domain-containing protein, partial [Acidobacteria bacterium]|nr:NAD(P)-binding domain-containing protein [Acidobacteriota bacterium]